MDGLFRYPRGGGDVGRVAVYAEAKIIFRACYLRAYLALQAQDEAAARVVGNSDISLQGKGLRIAASNRDRRGTGERDALQSASVAGYDGGKPKGSRK